MTELAVCLNTILTHELRGVMRPVHPSHVLQLKERLRKIVISTVNFIPTVFHVLIFVIDSRTDCFIPHLRQRHINSYLKIDTVVPG